MGFGVNTIEIRVYRIYSTYKQQKGRAHSKNRAHGWKVAYRLSIYGGKKGIEEEIGCAASPSHITPYPTYPAYLYSTLSYLPCLV